MRVELRVGTLPTDAGADDALPTPAASHVVWTLADQWRFNTTYAKKEAGYFDQAITRTRDWQLAPTQLVLMRPDRAAPVSRDLSVAKQQYVMYVRHLLVGVLDSSAIPKQSLRPVLGEGGAWTLDQEISEGAGGRRFRVRASGRFDTATGEGEVMESSLGLVSEPESEPFRSIRAADHRDSWIKGVRVAGHAEFRDRSARVRYVVTLDSAAKVSAEELESVFKPPAPGQSDVIRGMVETGTLHDYTGERLVSSEIHGSETTSVLGDDRGHQRMGPDWVRRGAWALGGLVAAAGVVVVIFRKRSAAARRATQHRSARGPA
jgi:hypothetical protein